MVRFVEPVPDRNQHCFLRETLEASIDARIETILAEVEQPPPAGQAGTGTDGTSGRRPAIRQPAY